MAWFGTMCHIRPIDELKPYYVFRESNMFSHHYNLMLVGFNVLAKCCVPENFKSKGY
jgi:hypothetical protein